MGLGLDATTLSVASLLIGLAAVMAGIEAALVALPEARLRALRDELGPRGGLLEKYLQDPTRTLSRLLAGQVIGPIVAAALLTRSASMHGASHLTVALVVTLLALTYGAVSEVMVTACRLRARSIAPTALRWIRPLTLLLSPFAALLAAVGVATTRVLHAPTALDPEVTEKEVEYVVEAAQRSGAVDETSREMLENVFELKGRTARELMVPRTSMLILDGDTALDEALARMRDDGHSRVPVYRGQNDNIIGILFAKDLFRAATMQWIDRDGSKVERLDDMVRKPVFFVTENQSALTVLRDMQSRRMHLAIVVDHFGSVKGLITLEDVLEELVGDIDDEHDDVETEATRDEHWKELGPGRWMASATIPISDLEERLGLSFPEDGEYASLGGFLADRAGKVPEPGTVVLWQGLRFVVREGDKRRARKVEIVREAERHTSSPPASGAP